MDERQIIKALRGRDPQGITAVYDRYAEGLYDYGWWLLRDHGTAREALHDTLLAAGVHADALRSPERLRPWLYALLRAECLRRSPATPRTDGDETGPDSSELRSLAWKATEGVPASESDALELHVRHGIEIADLATIHDMPVGEMENLLEQARIHIGHALRAEMLLRIGPGACPDFPTLPDGGQLLERYERIDRHARNCSTCSERVPRRVSIARLMALLPTVSPPEDLRARVIDAYTEPRLLEYRLLAARRMQPLAEDGFPQPYAEPQRASRGAAALATVSGLVAAGLFALAGLVALRFAPMPPDAQAHTQAWRTVIYNQAGAQSDGPSGRDANQASKPGGGPEKGGERRGAAGAENPSRRTSRPAAPLVRWPAAHLVPSPSGSSSQSSTEPSSGQLRLSTHAVDMGTESSAQVKLAADSGPVSWSTRPGTPCLSVSPASGDMDPGDSTAVKVTLHRDDPDCPDSGEATITFQPDGRSLEVSWSRPSPSPSPSASSSGPSPTSTTSRSSGSGSASSHSTTPQE